MSCAIADSQLNVAARCHSFALYGICRHLDGRESAAAVAESALLSRAIPSPNSNGGGHLRRTGDEISVGQELDIRPTRQFCCQTLAQFFGIRIDRRGDDSAFLGLRVDIQRYRSSLAFSGRNAGPCYRLCREIPSRPALCIWGVAMMLSGWGRYPRANCRVVAPRDEAELRMALLSEPSVIVRGNGRSYGDPALNPKATFSLRHMDRFKSFDPMSGLLETECGVFLQDIIETFLPRGWFIPVTPGTKFVTLGGMIAADVHGKNHHGAGSFGDHVESLELMLADGRVLRCSNSENRELFDATRGGMGLTGIICSAVVRMLKVESAYIRQGTVRTRDLVETMEAFEQSRGWTYTVAWIDSLATGRKLGRCILYRGEHARKCELPANKRGEPLAVARRRVKTIPFEFPRFALNRVTVSLFNALYYSTATPGSAIVDYDTYFYPLDAIADWNRIYGPTGFLQYQCVLPAAASRSGLTEIMTRVARSGTASFLSVLKLLGPGRDMLSFPMEGYTLALDFPAKSASFMLLTELDSIVEAHGGRIYLAKDARMGATLLRQSYGGLDAFKSVRRSVDPSGKFTSLQSERLGL